MLTAMYLVAVSTFSLAIAVSIACLCIELCDVFKTIKADLTFKDFSTKN